MKVISLEEYRRAKRIKEISERLRPHLKALLKAKLRQRLRERKRLQEKQSEPPTKKTPI